MKTVAFTDFRQQASNFLTEVEQGETLIIIRHGKPIAEISPFRDKSDKLPSWKQPGLRLQLKGSALTEAILAERQSSL